MIVLTLTFIKTKWLKLIWFRHSNCMSHVSKLFQPFTEVWSLICICLCQASLIRAWEETFLMVALTKTFLCVPLHLWFIPATAMYLWLSFPLFFCLSQWLDERSQKERSVLTGGDRSNSQLPIVFLKQESSWRKIWIRFWLAGQTCEHIDISLKYMQVIQAIRIRDMDAKLALSFALFKHVSLIFSKIKKNTCLEIIELKSLVTCFKVRSAVVLYF